MFRLLSKKLSTSRRLVAAPALAIVTLSACVVAAPALSQQVTEQVQPTDFDAAMRGLGFNPGSTDGNLDASSAGNGILDADEMALVGAVLKDPTLDLKARGGVDHASVATAFAQAQASAASDFQKLTTRYPTSPTVGAGYAMLGEGSLPAVSGPKIQGLPAPGLFLLRFGPR